MSWKNYRRNVRRLQQRIYRAERRGDWKRAHSLQRLLLRSWSARCLKVKGDNSPYDEDWVYWVQRMRRDPTKPERVIRLLKRQNGRCMTCGLCFTTEDAMEVHHWDGDRQNNRYKNLALLHAPCHDQIHGERWH